VGGLLGGQLVLSVVQYQMMNMPDFIIGWDGWPQKMGSMYASKAAKDEVIITRDETSPQIIFYAGRNIRFEKDTLAAINFLKTNHRSKGVFISTYTRAAGIVLLEETHLSVDNP